LRTGTSPESHYLETWGDARAFDGNLERDSAADRAALSHAFRALKALRLFGDKPGSLRITIATPTT